MGISDTLAQRGARYGDFSQHAEIAQQLVGVMQSVRGQPREGDPFGERRVWDNLDAVKRQALTVIADKIARILNGDPNYRDNWHDIQGYAKLAEDRCVADGQTELDLAFNQLHAAREIRP